MSLRARLTGLSPWRRRLLLTAAGALTVLALPPVHAVPVLFLTFPVLVWLLAAADGLRRAFGAGWWFGLGFFAAGLYWVSHSMLVDPARHGWMIPFALVGLGGGMALFTALTTLTARLVAGRAAAPALLVLALAAGWTLFEWVRAWLLTGFPWNLMGYAWTPWPVMTQGAALFGAYGLSFVTVLAAAMPATLGWPAARRRVLGATGAALLLVGLMGLGGLIRLQGAAPAMVPDVALRLVQPAIPQALKWKAEHRQAFLRRHVEMSRPPGAVTHVIWPETAAPVSVDLAQRERRLIASAAPPGGLVITGAPRFARGDDGTDVFNSLFAVNRSGAVVGVYDKAHLVPFGEYVPMRALIPIAKITEGAGDFSAGVGPVTLDLPGLPPVSPLICYEVIFPGSVVDAANRPGWLLNVTNDGWFGLSSGPHQHFASARMRAVEEGLPLVRVANTGISAVVDPFGRVIDSLPLGSQGTLDAPLPRALAPTPFAILGPWPPLGLACLTLLGVALARRRK